MRPDSSCFTCCGEGQGLQQGAAGDCEKGDPCLSTGLPELTAEAGPGTAQPEPHAAGIHSLGGNNAEMYRYHGHPTDQAS